ncbi:MAG: error-prone DNA polymerase [Burkholderiaceae bacterium]|nr:error-prone DNA polymerase [Burkholderiaceae bacterium]
MEFAELVCRSNYSFLHGASHPAELVERAHALGYRAIAITDESSVAGVVQAHMAAKSLGIKLLIGAQFVCTELSGRIVVLATSRRGYAQLGQLITQTRRREVKGQYRLLIQDLESGLPDCLVIWLADHTEAPSQHHQAARRLKELFADRLYIGCCLLLRGHDAVWRDHLQTIAALYRIGMVATSDVVMHRRSRKPLADTLTAIRHGLPFSACGRRFAANAEQHLRTRLRLARIYSPELMSVSLAMSERCDFSLDELRYEYPEEIVPAGLTPTQWLRHLTEEGAQRRFPDGVSAKVRQQLEHELGLIDELRYAPYFLTVYDIVAFARSRGILCQGRGSAANSAVCYCLGITEVDPARMSMLFERFISRERNEPPDIDVDFEHQRREEVIQYIYQKYGRERAALAASVTTYRPRSALRDVGKALGIHPLLVDHVARHHQWWDGKKVDATLLAVHLHQALQDSDLAAQVSDADMVSDTVPDTTIRWAMLCNQLIGFPRHLSQHVGGFVIARHRLSDLVPVENAAMPDRSVIQWNKDDIEALGLLKVDVLALGMLSAIRRALEFIGQKLGCDFQMQDIPAEDPDTYDMICAADTIGVFQIESRAQMSMLPRLKPRCFYDLVIEVAIVRPGPIQGGMVHPYLRRRQGLEPVEYPGPAVREALSRTLGVPIFQEQVMQLAILAAGFTAGEADQLRRSMAAWRRKGGLEKFHDRVVDGMLARGYPREFADRVFRQIEGFGEYGFPESHAASFALLVYVSCWIKRHHPDAFLAAMLNAQPLGFYSPSQLIQDARRHGVKVLPVDVQFSKTETHMASNAVQLGLNRIAGLSQSAMNAIARHQPFASVEDLASRTGLDRSDLNALAAAGALKSIVGNRHQAVWASSGQHRKPPLLQASQIHEPALALPAPTACEDVVADYASLGFTLKAHPLALLRSALAPLGVQPASTLNQYRHGRLARAAGLVTHRQRPGTAQGTLFVSLEDETGMINVIIWPDVLRRFYEAVLYSQLMLVYGTWQRDQTIDPSAPGQVRNLLAQRVEDRSDLLQALIGPIATSSRDFH